MKRSLIELGAIDIGQVLHKQLNYKPSLWIVRDQEEMQKLPKPKLCNEIWKPISTDSSPSEKHEEDATDRFYKNQIKTINGKDLYIGKDKWTSKEIEAEGRQDEENIGPNN